jgi:hypothetical protein
MHETGGFQTHQEVGGMSRLRWAVVVAAALAAVSVLYMVQARMAAAATPPSGAVMVAQAPGGGAGGWGQMSEAERAKMREQMTARMLDEAGLTDAEKTAAKKALTAKARAREALTQQLTKLRRTANQAKPTDKDLRAALAAYGAALTQYHKQVAATDAALVKQLSTRSRARCISLGILDNGLGMMGRMGGGGQSGPGGARRPRG